MGVTELGHMNCVARANLISTADKCCCWSRYLGIITFLDPPRADTADTIRRARESGVEVKMITGDQCVIACEMAKSIGLGTNILLSDAVPELPADMKAPLDTGVKYGKVIEASDGFAQVFPEHKFMIVEALKQRGWTCGMTGDGVNDAPALKVANVGIAVQGSTAAAQAAADIVLTEPGLGTIITAITLSREIFQRLRNYVIYRVSCSAQLLLFFFISVVLIQVASPGFVGMSPACQNGGRLPPDIIINDLVLANVSAGVLDRQAEYAQVSALCNKQFELPVTTIVLITLLNNGAIVSIAYDRVISDARPASWRLPEVFAIATVISTVAVFSNILFLWLGLSANAQDSWLSSWGLIRLPEATFDTTKYEWQLSEQTQIPCPAGGCQWAMCDPPHAWSSLTPIEQLEWQQPNFCLSYSEVQTMMYLILLCMGPLDCAFGV